MTGFSYLLRGFGMLGNKGLKRWVIIPLLLNTILFSLVIWLLTTVVNDWIVAASSSFDLEDTWFYFIDDTLYILLWGVFGLAIALLLYYTFIRLAYIVAGPFNAFLSERVEAQVTGTIAPQTSYAELAKQIWPMLKNELAKLRYEIARTIIVALVCLGLSFLGPFSLLVPVVWFAFNSWIYGFLFLDYPLDNNGFKLKEELDVLRSNKGLTYSFGAVITIVTMIPIINFLVMPAAVIGGTLLWVEKIKPRLALSDASSPRIGNTQTLEAESIE